MTKVWGHTKSVSLRKNGRTDKKNKKKKNTQGEGSQPKNVMPHIKKKQTNKQTNKQKPRDFPSDVLFDAELFYCSFYKCIC